MNVHREKEIASQHRSASSIDDSYKDSEDRHLGKNTSRSKKNNERNKVASLKKEARRG